MESVLTTLDDKDKRELGPDSVSPRRPIHLHYISNKIHEKAVRQIAPASVCDVTSTQGLFIPENQQPLVSLLFKVASSRSRMEDCILGCDILFSPADSLFLRVCKTLTCIRSDEKTPL